jgi:signal transduction histidine kinase
MIKRLDVIADQIERITNIVRSMLDSTRRPSLQLRSTDLNSLLVRILEASQPTLTARNVDLTTDMSAELKLIEADLDQLQQVFINLINNSLDAMPGGGKLMVSTRNEGEAVVVELADTGTGITEDHLDLIFEPMFSTKEGRGTGLGLTIVKRIISEHGGEIDVQSQSAGGTLFRLKLPVIHHRVQPDAPARRAEQAAFTSADSTGAHEI